MFFVKCSQFERKLSLHSTRAAQSHSHICANICDSEPVRLRLLWANIFIRHPKSAASSCAGDFAPSKAQQSGGKCHIIDVHSARLSADRTLRTCPRDTQHWRPQVCAGRLFPHVKLISCNRQQADGKSEMAVTGAEMCSETDN